MGENPPPKADEISGALNRVDHLGATTERLFSRVYRSLSRRSKQREQGERRHQLQQEIEVTRRLREQTEYFRDMIKKRDQEIERLSGVLNTIDEGIIMQDEEGRIVLINEAAHSLLGSQKNFWESELGTLFDSYRAISIVAGELAPLGAPTSIQVNNRILGAQLAAVGDSEGRRLGTMIVLRDVTRDALAERLKSQFILSISHELNTPMTVIKGMSELLAGQPEDQPANRMFLEKLTRNVDILNSMVVELLDLSEMGAGSFSIRQDEVNLEPLIWSVVQGKTPEIRRNQLDMAVMLRDVQRLKVSGDNERLRWALGHLVQNSARYTEPTGHITVTAGLQDARYVAIRVIDTGVGIAEKDLPHVFEQFYRGEARAASGKLLDPRGLGQGLFIARTVAEAHGGYVRLESQQFEGSTFTMVLPTARSEFPSLPEG